MTNSKATKKALFTSVISLLLCFTMLMGATFAWFTDTVKSTNNIIKSGNLDIELYYQVEGEDPNKWTQVTADTNIFKENALWEPGYTEVVKLKAVNMGSLALKYQLGVNVVSEVTSTNVDGGELKLSKHIKYGIVDGAENYTRDTAIKAVDAKATELAAPYTSDVISLYPKNYKGEDGVSYPQERIVTLVVYMPTTVDNVANHAKDAPVPTINLGLNVSATQLAAEVDSFDNTYDKNADFDGQISTYEALAAAVAKGGVYQVAADFAIDEKITVAAGTSFTLNLNGHNLTSTTRTFTIEEGATLNVEGNGTVTSTATDAAHPMFRNNGTLNINGGTYVIKDDTSDGTNGRAVLIRNSAGTVNISNATFSSNALCQPVSNNKGATMNIVDSTITQTTLPWAAIDNDGTLEITNSSITGGGTNNPTIGMHTAGAKTTINSGTITTNGDACYSTSDNYDVIIKGGTFNVDPTDELADGYVAVDNGDGTWTVAEQIIPDDAVLQDAGYYLDSEDNFWVDSAKGLKGINEWYAANSNSNRFGGKVVNIAANIDASGVTWNSVEVSQDSTERPVGIVFDGHGKTIKNLTISGSGLFQKNACKSTFSDITFDNVTVNGGWHTGVIWGQAYGELTLDNVKVVNSNITGTCNVGALVGRNGDDGNSIITFKDCSVTNTKVTSTGGDGTDNCGASAFLGMALKTGGASITLTFEGSNTASGNTLTSATGHQGGGIYATASTLDNTWNTPVVVNDFTDYNNQ